MERFTGRSVLVYCLGLTLALCQPLSAATPRQQRSTPPTPVKFTVPSVKIPTDLPLPLAQPPAIPQAPSALAARMTAPGTPAAIPVLPAAAAASPAAKPAAAHDAKAPVLGALQERVEALRAPNAAPERELGRLFEGADGSGAVMSAAADPLAAALRTRDAAGIGELLRAASVVRGWSTAKQEKTADLLALALAAGRFREARQHLETLSASENDDGEFWTALADVRGRLPEADIEGAGALAEAFREVLATVSGDPFQLQARLSRLILGLRLSDLPTPVKALYDSLAMRISWTARERAAARRGPATGPAQKYSDCWIRSLYDLPIKVLEPLRRALTYEQFLQRVVAEFPALDIKKKGLPVESFPALMRLLGLKASRHDVDQDALEALLFKHGAVIASVGWFPKDAAALPELEARLRFSSHAMVLAGVSGPRESREFKAIDSAVEHQTRYTMPELQAIQLQVYAVEPAGQGASESLRRFIQGR